MPTSPSIHVLNVYAEVFQRFGYHPVRWDRSKKKFIYRLNHRELLFWNFNVAAVLFGTFCCGLICLREIFVKVNNVSTYVLVIQIFLMLMGMVTGFAFALLFLIHGQVGTIAWDYMCGVENILDKGN